MTARVPALALLALSIAACTTPAAQSAPEAVPMVAEPPVNQNWRRVALAEDIAKIEGLAAAWQRGLGEARARGFASAITAAGPLLNPASGLPRAEPPPGPYRCRVTRLGTGPRRRALTVYPLYFCHVVVEGDSLAFAKQDGADRPGGYLFPDSENRMIFLGATAQGRETVPPAYGANAARNIVGVAERIGPMRYRIAFPSPGNGAALDIIEMVPSPDPLE
jgi:hypothetical protein